MDAKGVRNMLSILVVFNKHNTARVASCWVIIYYIIDRKLEIMLYIQRPGCSSEPIIVVQLVALRQVFTENLSLLLSASI